ncbi:LamG-like jellyroll fold domain-containing protein [Streptomyces chilikensis]|uniref:LamG-like jellyroll fold domain-containing protein n=1 Tax=Streptomyces chilikensis TaxID=1194079 RepID=UPI00140D86F5|nr:LamG-like jellyroll fold domain-containing protein [Streptomyces chilikensis]
MRRISVGIRSRSRTVLVTTTLSAVLTTSLGVLPTPGSAPQSAAAADQQATASGATEAQFEAVRTGKSVEVLALRDERATTVANPDGTFTHTQYVQPVRVRKDGKWTGIDTDLVRQEDGSWGPKAALTAMSFSDGGTATFARMEKDGRFMSMDWPGKLPKPKIDGPTALYRNVLKDVDLKVTASADGFAHVLVVKNAKAANHPELAQLDLPVRTRGLTLAKTAAGGVEAKDPATGGAVFEAAQPMMWDSSGVTPESGSETAGAETAAPPTVPAEAPTDASAAVMPPDGSRVADVGLGLARGKLTLKTDLSLLRGKDTVYPVYIDPVNKTASRTGWTMVSSHHSSSEFWKFSEDEGVGRCPADVSYLCVSSDDRKRQFFAIPTGTFEGKKIVSAEFAVTMVHTYNTSGRAVELGRVNSSGASAINSGTNWGNQPSLKDNITSKSPTNPAGSCTSTNQNVRFPVTSTVQKAADSGWDTTTFRLKAAEESDYSYWKRFCGNAHLEVTYNRPPLQPAMKDLTMAPGGVCEYGRPEEHYVAAPPKITAVIKDYDHNDVAGKTESLQAEFRVFWVKDGVEYSKTAMTAAVSTRNAKSSSQTGVATFTYTVGDDVTGDGQAGFTVPQNVVIGWEVRGYDGQHSGPWSSAGDVSTRCEFIYDATAPKPPVISSTDYPSDGAWHAGVGDYGSFTFDSSDADVTSYVYRFKGDSDWKQIESVTAGGPATVRWMPPDEGPMYVEAKAVDGAGNARKTVTAYTFLVSDGRAPVAGWTLGDAKGSTSAAGTSGAPAAAAGSGVTFGNAGPTGPADTAASFDGTAGAYLDAGVPVVDTSRTFSVSAWVNIAERPADDITIVSQDGSGQPGFELGYDVDTQSWVFRTPTAELETMGTWKVSGATAIPDSWMHLIGVYDEVTGKLSLSVDGDLLEEDIQARPTPWDATGPLQIGRKIDLDGYTGHFKGSISDVQVHDRVITEAEGETLGGSSAAQLAYWAMDSAASGAVPDETEGGVGLTLGGGASVYLPDDSCDPALDPDCMPVAEPLWGDGHLALDGVDDHATRGAGLLAKEDSFTLTTRARLASSAPGKDLTVLSLAGSAGSALEVRYVVETDRWQLRTTDKDGASAAVSEIVSNISAPSSEGDGDHLAVVYSAVLGDVLLYVNGELAAKTAWDNSWDFTTASVQVGRTVTGSTASGHFSGAVDELRIFRGALDPSMVPLVAGLVSGESIADTVS